MTLALDQFWSLKKMVLERRHGEYLLIFFQKNLKTDEEAEN